MAEDKCRFSGLTDVFGSLSESFCQILPPQRRIDPVTLFLGGFTAVFGVILPNHPAPTRHRFCNAISGNFTAVFRVIFGVILPNAPAPTRHRFCNAIFGRFYRRFRVILPNALAPTRHRFCNAIFGRIYRRFQGHFAKSSRPNETSIL